MRFDKFLLTIQMYSICIQLSRFEPKLDAANPDTNDNNVHTLQSIVARLTCIDDYSEALRTIRK